MTAAYLCLLLTALPACAADLFVATGKVDITAPLGYPMGGYGARKGVATGVHDPLLAKVLLIKSNGQQLGIVTFDLVWFASERIAREARERLGIPVLLQISSHTHSGPIPKDLKAIEQDTWFRDVESKVLRALEEAQARYRPARVAVAETSVLIGHNRRKVNDDASVTMFWRNADRLPTSPVDPRAGILRFKDTEGNVLVVLINYACHAVVLGPDNLSYSADWPGAMCRYIESQAGGNAIAYFIPGAGGDINPYDDKQPLSQGAFEVARKTGETLGKAVVPAMRAARIADDPEFAVSEETYDFQERFNPKARLLAQVTRILIGKDTGILAAPGEFFVRHQINLRDRSPLRHTFLFGYAFAGQGKFLGYVPTIEAAMQGGYGAGYATRVEVGAGEMMVDRAIVWFYQRLGKLRDLPDVP